MPLSVFLIPDRFAHYRFPLFTELSAIQDLDMTILTDSKSDIPGLKIVDPALCDLDIQNGGVKWVPVGNIVFRGRCVWQKGLLSKILRSNADVFIFWGEVHRITTWLAVCLCKIKRKQTVLWTHGLYGRESFWKRKLRVTFYKLADALLTYNQRGKDLLIAQGMSPDGIFVIHNSLGDPNKLCPLPPDKHINNKIVFSGRLTERKRIDMLIQAIAKLHTEGHETQCSIIGDGSARDRLQHMASTLKVNHLVTFHGACYDEPEIAQLFLQADLCVSPGEVGLTAIHAMSYGIPVLTHDNFDFQMPEFESIIPGKTGGFFKHNDLEDLVSKIQCALISRKHGEMNPEVIRKHVANHWSTTYQVEVFKKMMRFVSDFTPNP